MFWFRFSVRHKCSTNYSTAYIDRILRHWKAGSHVILLYKSLTFSSLQYCIFSLATQSLFESVTGFLCRVQNDILGWCQWTWECARTKDVSFARTLRLRLLVCQFPETLSPPVIVCVVMETCLLELISPGSGTFSASELIRCS